MLAADEPAEEKAADEGPSTLKGGTAQDGTQRDGTAADGTAADGTAADETAEDGAAREATAHAGPPHQGSVTGALLRRETATIGDERLRAKLAERVRQARPEGGNLPLLVTHGYGVDDDPKRLESMGAGPPPELLSLSDNDMATIAEDIVSALVATNAEPVARARDDQRWDAHLGPLIREAWSDFQACVGAGPAADRHFRNALNRVLAEGREVF